MLGTNVGVMYAISTVLHGGMGQPPPGGEGGEQNYESTFNDSVTVDDSFASEFGAPHADAVEVVDVFLASVGQPHADAIEVADAFAASVGKAHADAVTAADSFAASVGKALSEALSIADVFDGVLTPGSAPITRTAKGAAYAEVDDSSLGEVRLSSVALTAGSTLVVACMDSSSTPADPDTVTAGVQGLTKQVAGGTVKLSVWTLDAVTGGTVDIYATWNSAGRDGIGIIAVEVTGATATPLDKVVTAAGTGTAPDSGLCAAIAQADELLLGFVGWRNLSGSGVYGSWSGSFSAGQSAAATGVWAGAIGEGYRVVSSIAQYQAAKTGADSDSWQAAIITLKAAS